MTYSADNSAPSSEFSLARDLSGIEDLVNIGAIAGLNADLMRRPSREDIAVLATGSKTPATLEQIRKQLIELGCGSSRWKSNQDSNQQDTRTK